MTNDYLVEEIFWDNIYIYFKLNKTVPAEIVISMGHTLRYAAFKMTDDQTIFKINVTNFSHRRFIDRGCYAIGYINEMGLFSQFGISKSINRKIKAGELTKIFPYNQGAKLYTLEFLEENRFLMLLSTFWKDGVKQESLNYQHAKMSLTTIHWQDKTLHLTCSDVEEVSVELISFDKLGVKETFGKTSFKNEVVVDFTRDLKVSGKQYFYLASSGSIGESENIETVTIDDKLATGLAKFDRVIRLSDQMTYLVKLFVESIDDEHMTPIVMIAAVAENSHPEKPSYGLTTALNVWFMNSAYLLFSSFMFFKKRHILILSEVSDTLNGNLDFFKNKLYETGQNLDYKIKVMTRETLKQKQSNYKWLKFIWQFAWANYIFLDNYSPTLNYLKVNKQTKIIQLWHAGIGFKAVGYARFGKKGSPHPYLSSHRKYQYALSPSPNAIEIYQEVFGIGQESFLPYGMSRLENFLDDQKINTVRKKYTKAYEQLKNKKIILFAPTYRGEGQRDAYYNFSKIDFDRLNEVLGDDYVFIIKLHPYTNYSQEFYLNKIDYNENRIRYQQRVLPNLEKYQDRIINLTDQYQLNELLYLTDILITDYSSAYYEFTLFDKPIIFYTYDRILYEETRGVHMSVKSSAPGNVCDTFSEVLDVLQHGNFEMDKISDFRKRYFIEDINQASDKIINKLLNLDIKKDRLSR